MNINEISIRRELRPGDLGYVMHRHGVLYSREFGYGIEFEAYVGGGLADFYGNYDPKADAVWVCEHGDRIVGFLALMHRAAATAQLRFFYLEPDYRGLGLGKTLMQAYMDFLAGRGYRRSYLWTTHELGAAAALYIRHGFRLTEEKESSAFGKRLREQRYDWIGGDMTQ
ncbi:MAG TPA: GNAT family N-acetyltransferase [Puia sp.]|nr:GNAT family N-acetyltransferase [Puia sp.]